MGTHIIELSPDDNKAKHSSSELRALLPTGPNLFATLMLPPIFRMEALMGWNEGVPIFAGRRQPQPAKANK
jgi:hypothetical protein